MTDNESTPEKLKTTMGGMTINWHAEHMNSTYANIGTATASREEFFLLFGSHQNWHGAEKEKTEADVDLTQRIVMNPFAAKRMALILGQAVKAYEERFGELKL